MIKNELKTVFHNASYLMITQAAMYIAPLFVLSYLLKTLGVKEFGYYALILAIVAYLQIITDYGFSFSSSRAISQNRDDKNYLSEIYCATMVIKLIICFIVFLFLYITLYIFPIGNDLATGLIYGYVIVLGNREKS